MLIQHYRCQYINFGSVRPASQGLKKSVSLPIVYLCLKCSNKKPLNEKETNIKDLYFMPSKTLLHKVELEITLNFGNALMTMINMTFGL